MAVIYFAFAFCRSRCVDVQVCVTSRIHVAHPRASAVVWHCSPQLQLLCWDGLRVSCSQDQEEASKGVGSGSSFGLWAPWGCVIPDACSEYLVAASLFKCETMRFVGSGDCFLFSQKNHCSYSWFWSLIHVLMGWCPCPVVNVAWKNLVGWLVFLSIFLYLYGLMNKK